ncbi:hypothetical protein NDN08_004031 [Rhodosorus marinus]|uniref:Nuclear pore complex protein n=1 Tax=Rhodosorus marinus TaxID=101924 RepID=A0AAV8UMF8_9RHOD|nr:hypothetical protein NDN08_004031 [Rhodosorus marinus]
MKRFVVDDCGAFALTDVLEEDLTFGLQVHHTIGQYMGLSYITFHRMIKILLTSHARMRQDGILWNMRDMMTAEKSRDAGAYCFLGMDSRDDDLLLDILLECLNFLVVEEDSSEAVAKQDLKKLLETYVGSDELVHPQWRNIELFLHHVTNAIRTGRKTFVDQAFLKQQKSPFILNRLGRALRKAVLFSIEKHKAESYEVLMRLWEELFDQQRLHSHRASVLDVHQLSEKLVELPREEQEEFLLGQQNPRMAFWICQEVVKNQLRGKMVEIPAELRMLTMEPESFVAVLMWSFKDARPDDKLKESLLALYLAYFIDLFRLQCPAEVQREGPRIIQSLTADFKDTLLSLDPVDQMNWNIRLKVLESGALTAV